MVVELSEKEVKEIRNKVGQIPSIKAKTDTILVFVGGQFFGLLALIVTLIVNLT